MAALYLLIIPGQFDDMLKPASASGTKSFVTTIPLPNIL